MNLSCLKKDGVAIQVDMDIVIVGRILLWKRFEKTASCSRLNYNSKTEKKNVQPTNL